MSQKSNSRLITLKKTKNAEAATRSAKAVTGGVL